MIRSRNWGKIEHNVYIVELVRVRVCTFIFVVVVVAGVNRLKSNRKLSQCDWSGYRIKRYTVQICIFMIHIPLTFLPPPSSHLPWTLIFFPFSESRPPTSSSPPFASTSSLLRCDLYMCNRITHIHTLCAPLCNRTKSYHWYCIFHWIVSMMREFVRRQSLMHVSARADNNLCYRWMKRVYTHQQKPQ